MADLLMPDLRICTDCAMFAANGEVFDSDGNDVTDQHAELFEAAWDGWRDATTGRFPHLVVNGDDEPSFGTSPCDGCDSPLAGDRYGASLIG